MRDAVFQNLKEVRGDLLVMRDVTVLQAGIICTGSSELPGASDTAGSSLRLTARLYIYHIVAFRSRPSLPMCSCTVRAAGEYGEQ
jgi:hypothetical protein